MSRTHLSHALLALIEKRYSTGAALAKVVQLTGATVSRACAGERLSVDSLRSLCTRQPIAQDGLELLVAHLRDEVDRAGRLQTEVTIEAEGIEIDENLRFLAERALHDENLAGILSDLADLARKVQRNEALGMVYPLSELPQPRVAEERSEGCAESGEKKAEDGAPV